MAKHANMSIEQAEFRSASAPALTPDTTTNRCGTDATAENMVAEEAGHRLRNLMALVTSVVRQTKTQNRTALEFREVLLARLQNVMRFQVNPTHADDLPRDLQALALQELQSVCGPRLELEQGPKVALAASQARAMTLILHELATNAVKYGALSTANGRVRLGWEVTRGEAAPQLVMEWRESGGPVVRAPERMGFGVKLIRASAAAELGGTAELLFEPTGLRAVITAQRVN